MHGAAWNGQSPQDVALGFPQTIEQSSEQLHPTTEKQCQVSLQPLSELQNHFNEYLIG